MADPSDQRALGDAVRHLRDERGLSQKALAEATGLHVTYISGIERGRRNPTWAVLLTLSDALGVKASKLVERSEQSRRR